MSKSDPITVASDCKYFLGDRPCSWHKMDGVICRCEHYSQIREKILVIKLDAMGDVLRTTCILPGLRKRYPASRITWITRSASVPLLQNNPFIDEIVSYGTDAMINLLSRHYDEVLNLDAGKISAGLATAARAEEKTGFVMNPNGYVQSTNPAAEEWLKLGVFDDLKKRNERTYQEVICSILDLSTEDMGYVLDLLDEERNAANAHLLDIGLDPLIPIIGIHTGGGDRWALKQWAESSFVQLISEMKMEQKDRIQILLFGGPFEKERNRRIVAKLRERVFDAGCENEVRHFAALISGCSVIITGDSLALHVALAMGRRTVALFGPTSFAEIEMFGLGEKVIPDMDCLVCYQSKCEKVPSCMDSISVNMVRAAIHRQLKKIPGTPGI